MSEITTIGIDLAKHSFQLHGVDAGGVVVLRRTLRRHQLAAFFKDLPRCVVGMEACATSHYWAREIAGFGHDVRLMPPQYVKAYVKRNKNDAADAEAICEAVLRPSMRFVPIKTIEQQSTLMLHRARELLVGQRTMSINALRAHLAEFGIVAPQGVHRVGELAAIVTDESDTRVPEHARVVLKILVDQIGVLTKQIEAIEGRISGWHRSNAVSQRLAGIPGIGPIIASAIVASVPDASVFRAGREFAAWLGLVPRQTGTGGKTHLGPISKRGDGYLRRLLVNGAMTALMRSKAIKASAWVAGMKARQKRPIVIAVALANKMARIAWALMARGGTYRATAA
ncbi:MAG: IS110 family transposase [Burkholderiales bacterium]